MFDKNFTNREIERLIAKHSFEGRFDLLDIKKGLAAIYDQHRNEIDVVRTASNDVDAFDRARRPKIEGRQMKFGFIQDDYMPIGGGKRVVMKSARKRDLEAYKNILIEEDLAQTEAYARKMQYILSRQTVWDDSIETLGELERLKFADDADAA
jgi:hypothetical protein